MSAPGLSIHLGQRLSILHEADGQPDCSNCGRRGRDDDAWHTLFECPAFQQYQEDAMTTLQEMVYGFLLMCVAVQCCLFRIYKKSGLSNLYHTSFKLKSDFFQISLRVPLNFFQFFYNFLFNFSKIFVIVLLIFFKIFNLDPLLSS